MKVADLRFSQESYQIRGAVFEVYREMGSGFLEAVYQEGISQRTQGAGAQLSESYWSGIGSAGQLRPSPISGN